MSEEGASYQRAVLFTGIVTAMGILAASLTVAEARTKTAVQESARWVAHTLEVVREFQTVHSLIEEAETGQRGFLLTEREMYLSVYENARPQIGTHVERLRMLTADNPAQEARLDGLTALVSRKFALMAQTIVELRAHRREEALRIVLTNEGRDLMEAIHSSISDGIADEDRLLTERQAMFAATLRARSMYVIGLVAVVVATVLLIGVLLLRLGRVRVLARICSWSRTVEYQGEWITFEQYLLRRFNVDVTHGISPTEAERFLRERGDPRRI